MAEKVITLHLQPDVADGLESLADAQGSSVEQYVLQLVKREVSLNSPEVVPSEQDGLVWEDGLLVYRTGNPLPSHLVDDVIGKVREERIKQILGDHGQPTTQK